jgi:hypothetical protein
LAGADGVVLLFHVASPSSLQYIIQVDVQLEKLKKGYHKVLVGLGGLQSLLLILIPSKRIYLTIKEKC